MVGFLLWILMGAIAGWLASVVMGSGASQGLLIDIVLGIVGAFVGGLVFNLLGVDASGGFIWSTFVAFVGAVVILALGRALRRA